MEIAVDPLIWRDCLAVAARLDGRLDPLAGGSVLVTGAGGFLGRWFVHSVLAFGESALRRDPPCVTCLDRFPRGVPDWLEHLRPHQRVKIIQADVTAPLPSDVGTPGYVIHAASIASPPRYRERPIETMDANVLGTRRLLDHAVARGDLKSLLVMSSSEIYGDPPADQIPTPEDYRGNVSPIGPRACYDESKRYAETLAVNFHRAYGVPVKIARPFNNFGPGLSLDDGRVISDLCARALRGEDLVLHSGGEPTRTFCYAADAVDGYWRILLSDHNGQAFNIGASQPEIGMRKLAELIARLAREELSVRPLKVVHVPSSDRDYLSDNPRRRCPNLRKARRLLDYEPATSLEEGLQKTLRWYAAQEEKGASLERPHLDRRADRGKLALAGQRAERRGGL